MQGLRAIVTLTLSTLAASPATSLAQESDLILNTLPGCRIIDTRKPGVEALAAGETRAFNIYGDLSGQGGSPTGCGFPTFMGGTVPAVQALVINYAVFNPTGDGTLKAWPGDQAEPKELILTYRADASLANSAITAVRQDAPGNDINIKTRTSGADVVADIVGYFSRNPPIAPNAVRATELAPVGSTNVNTPPLEAVPVVAKIYVHTGVLSGSTAVDAVFYNGNAPRSFVIIDAWIVDYFSNSETTWELRNATNGGGDAISAPRSLGQGTAAIDRLPAFGSTTPQGGWVIPANGTLVVRVSKSSPGITSAEFNAYVMMLPLP